MKNDLSKYEREEKREKRRGAGFWLATLVIGAIVLGLGYMQYLSAATSTTIKTVSIVDEDVHQADILGFQLPEWLPMPSFIGGSNDDGEDEIADIKDIIQQPLQSNQAMVSNIPAILQNPELPAGCEATALTIVLRQMGYDADKVDIVDNYMPMGDNVAISYVGDPRQEYGGSIYTPGLAITAEKYLNEQNARALVYDLWDMSFTNLCKIVEAGYPVIVWTTLDNEEPEEMRTGVTYKGRDYHWYNNQHCVVLYGYDLYNNTVYISDPKDGLVQRNAVQFDLVYTECGMNAMAILQ